VDEDSANAYPAMSREERLENMRHAALHNAVGVLGHTSDPQRVLAAARDFYAFLRDEKAPTNPPKLSQVA